MSMSEHTTAVDKALLYSDMALLYLVLSLNWESILALQKAMAQLPKSAEFNELKEELEKQKQNVISTLLPLKEAVENTKSRAERGDKIYG